ncbi:MAG TPA: hypothetical protein VF062_14220 [Candidatus Limnocylindrales bacterium]
MRPFTPAAGLVLLMLVTSACGTPPDLASRGDRVPAPPSAPSQTPEFPPGFTPAPTSSPSRNISPTPTLSPFPEYTAVPCAGRVTANQVIDLVRSASSISPSGAVAGYPLCAGSWQLTELQVPGRDSVLAVTITQNGLKLVAAGTDVCTAEVKLLAPSGIKLAAGC